MRSDVLWEMILDEELGLGNEDLNTRQECVKAVSCTAEMVGDANRGMITFNPPKGRIGGSGIARTH